MLWLDWIGMKLELFIFGITAFLIFNTYYDGKYLKVFHAWQKEIKMSTFAFVGLSLYIFLKKNPGQSRHSATKLSTLLDPPCSNRTMWSTSYHAGN